MLPMGYGSKNKEKGEQEPRSIPTQYPELL